MGAPFIYQGWHAVLGNEVDGRIVAVVIYTRDSSGDVDLHLVVESGSRWMTSDFIGRVFSYPFDDLERVRVSAAVSRSNIGLQRLLLALGFAIEGIRRKCFGDEDAVLFGMLKEGCRYG